MLVSLLALTSCGGGGGSSGTPLLGGGSVAQTQGWSVSLAGESIANTSPSASCVVQNGGGIICPVSGHNNTADTGTGAIIENYSVNLVATVTGSGGPVSGAPVTFSMGSSQTTIGGSYCSTATVTTTGNCDSGTGVGTGTLTAIEYQPGLGDPSSGKITSSIQTTTGADGKAYATYYPGGKSGYDVVVVSAGATTNSGTTNLPSNSATMQVQ
jgi:hypothetical protein